MRRLVREFCGNCGPMTSKPSASRFVVGPVLLGQVDGKGGEVLKRQPPQRLTLKGSARHSLLPRPRRSFPIRALSRSRFSRSAGGTGMLRNMKCARSTVIAAA